MANQIQGVSFRSSIQGLFTYICSSWHDRGFLDGSTGGGPAERRGGGFIGGGSDHA